MTIEEVYNNKEISVRSYNVCRRNGIDSIIKLQQYYTVYQTFENLHNCGRRSNEELIEIYLKYQNYTVDNDEARKVDKNSLEEILTNLTRTQREVINNFIKVNTNSLSVRSKNAISLYLGNNFSVRNFAEKIITNHNFKIENVENVGKKSIPELEIYVSIINDLIREISQSDDENQLVSLKNSFLIEQTFSISKVPTEILQSESIFQLIDFLLKNNALFNKNHNLTIQKALKIYQNDKEHTLYEIASQNSLSRERVRQIRKDCVNELFEKLSFIKNFNDDLFQNYGIDKSSSLIEVNESVAYKINNQSQTNFSKEFISYILAAYLSDDFLLIGNIEDVILPKFSNSRNRHNWSNFYIVSNKLSEVNFISLTDDVYKRLNERIEETYYFNFKSYLSKFIINIDIEIIDLAFPAAERIINDEFALYLDLDDNIVFKRNTIKQAFEYAYEALEQLGEPSSVDEITQKIFELHPNYETDENKVRSSMKRNNGFVPIGRTSVFGLKKWENELDNFKGGTIKNIVLEYLRQNDTPIHIYETLEEIHRYREETNARNVITNLKLDPQKQFTIFNQSFIGLNKKVYNSNLVNLPKFLGKSITNYIRQNNNVDFNSLNQYYSNLLGISNKNMSYILQQLIDNNFISINDQKILTV